MHQNGVSPTEEEHQQRGGAQSEQQRDTRAIELLAPLVPPHGQPTDYHCGVAQDEEQLFEVGSLRMREHVDIQA
jgi:hypothetical protein